MAGNGSIKAADAMAEFQAALNVRAHRQQLIASNIANADTPNYKATDVDFKSALDAALSGKQAGAPGVMRTDARHLATAPSSPFATATGYRTEKQASVDGNTVDMDTERAAFAENALQYEATLTFINHHFRMMQQAVSGQ